LIEADVKVINRSMGYSDTIVFAASRGNETALRLVRQESIILEDVLKRVIENYGYEFVICVAAGNSNRRQFIPYKESSFGYKIIDENSSYLDRTSVYRQYGNVFAKYSSSLAYIEDEVVKDRIIVVGSIGIDTQRSTSERTEYRYSSFSNVGDRVDIVAPGEDIYSTFVRGYGYMTGTSMASPHVAGVAGLVFAANPDLTGAEVKRIVLESAIGRFDYSGGHSGLLNAERAVMNALNTR
jgi:subtilisin family serine protease